MNLKFLFMEVIIIIIIIIGSTAPGGPRPSKEAVPIRLC